MTAVPPEAVEDAAEAIAAMFPNLGPPTCRVIAETALEAAEPHVRKVAQEQRVLSAIFACNSADCPRPFALHRGQDVTGVSGTGTVAHGVQFADGTVVIRWLGEFASTVVWDSLDAAMKVHGQDGTTRVVWVATDFSEMALAEEEAAAAERAQVYAELGNDHYVIFTEDGWTTEHSVECRLSGHMHECAIHTAIGEWAQDDPPVPGRWRIVSADGPVPVLERADLIGGEL